MADSRFEQDIREAVFRRTKKAAWEWPEDARTVLAHATHQNDYRKDKIREDLVNRICFIVDKNA